MSTSESAIYIKDIRKSFGNLEVLKGIDLRIPKGTVQALLGPNGAGKTTLVRILATLMKPDSGHAIVGGYDLINDPAKVQSVIGLAGQYASVDGKLSGFENLRMIGLLYHLSTNDAVNRANELLESFNLVDAAKRPVKDYSGGMRRRLDLAASLIVTPPILFLDEPTTGLDPKSRNDTWDIIRGIVASGTTLLLTTQYLDEADQLADNIAVIDNGVIIARGTPNELKSTLGDKQLELSLAAKEGFSKALQVFGKKIMYSDETNLTIKFSIPEGNAGISAVNHITGRCLTENIKVDDFSIYRPSLDDLFLKLTDKSGAQNTKEGENDV